MKTNHKKAIQFFARIAMLFSIVFSQFGVALQPAYAGSRPAPAIDEDISSSVNPKVNLQNPVTCEALLFSDDFSTTRGWIDESSGTVTRDDANQWLSWDARRTTPLHYYMPINANSSSIQLNLRFKVTGNSGNGMMWFGLAESLTNISPNVAAADRPGIYFAPDNNGKIQFISLYSDRTASFIGVPDSTINYGGYNVWRQASLTVNGLNWNIEVKDDNGALLGQMSGTLPKEHAAYDYVMLMFNYGSGWENMTGLLDDVQVSGCPNSQVNVQTIIDNSTVFPNNVSDVSMAVGDLTNDGILDIAITKGAESYGAGAAVFQGSGNTWDTGTLLAGPTKNNAYNPIVAPIRNDGQNWLVFPEHLWGNSGEWLRGNLYSGVGITDHCANTYG